MISNEPTLRSGIRHDWTPGEIRALYDLPFPELVYRAQTVHRQYHDPAKVQLCSLLSIKTGGCPEDCAYCPQSAHHDAEVPVEPLMAAHAVLDAARRARGNGATRFCMGAAWREVRDGRDFEAVLQMVRGVRELGMEACVTLGMVQPHQARALADAGLTAYNHNLDTSPEYYGEIITTRRYEDRLNTLENVREAGITVCCGGIIGMGEDVADRLRMLEVLARLDPHPESVPINALVRVAGTPLESAEPVSGLVIARMVATARVLMPRAMVRLSAGRTEMSPEAQALCFTAGANSIFSGDQLLTTPNPARDEDLALFRELGLETL
jgi:biotin synthase